MSPVPPRRPPFVDRIDALPKGARVLVGMSGGVDSSVAAALLVERGFDVVGVSLHLYEPDDPAASSRCCAAEDLADAARSADALGIPHFVFDRLEDFTAHVVDPFVDAYLAGTTPSPCVACNRDVKIGAFVALTQRLGAAAFATGHYARAGSFVDDGAIDRSSTRSTRSPALLRAVDRKKDQSYFLHGIGVSALSLLATPLGALVKDDVRSIARRHALPNADKPDSEDLCFVAGDHARFVEAHAKDRVRPGPIVDADGRVVGTHGGVHRFTIGQRKGLGVAVGKPAFVASIDAETATVRLGDARDLDADAALVADVRWLVDAPRSGDEVVARIRYRHEGVGATIDSPSSNGADRDVPSSKVRVRFSAPTRAVTPGQICVFYERSGERVLGGGTIVRAD